jgi:hypothetical protein
VHRSSMQSDPHILGTYRLLRTGISHGKRISGDEACMHLAVAFDERLDERLRGIIRGPVRNKLSGQWSSFHMGKPHLGWAYSHAR